MTGPSASILRTMRVGQGASVDSLYVSDDGKLFGAAGRFAVRFGSGFALAGATDGPGSLFTSFGSQWGNRFHFAASADGNTVMAPGVYGIVCWQRTPQGWQEAWSNDYWQKFDQLNWPVDAEDERIPQFHAYIPRGADYAVVVFCETTNNGWIMNNHANRVYVSAVSLKDGSERWRFDVPDLKSPTFPTLQASPNAQETLLQVQVGTWGSSQYRFYKLDKGGKLLSEWRSTVAPKRIALDDRHGTIAEVFADRLLEIRDAKGKLLQSVTWDCQPVSLAFSGDGTRLYVADDTRHVWAIEVPTDAQAAEIKILWQIRLPCVSTLAAHGDNLYAAGWDGMLRSFDSAGAQRWQLNCTPTLSEDDPIKALAQSAGIDERTIFSPKRPANTQDKPGAGENMLKGCDKATREVRNAEGKVVATLEGVANANAFVHVGGIANWMSAGQVQVTAAELVNGKTDDVDQPWLSVDELHWDARTGRQVWVEIDFEKPTDVQSLTVYENPTFRTSWPSDGLVQVWDGQNNRWQTAKYGIFMNSSVNTYGLNLKAVTKLRYVPWNSYYWNFHTSEIEVR